MAITSKIAKLEAVKAKVAEMEREIAAGLPKELAGLPAAYGFDSVKAFVKAIKAASKGKTGKAKKTMPKKKGARRGRAVITEATRAKVKKLVQAGKSGSQIVKVVGISLPSVQNIKKALGLVKSRKAKARKTALRKAPKKRAVRKVPVVKAPAEQEPIAPEAPKAP